MNNSFAEDIVKKALKRGCDAAEVFIRSSRGISVEAKDGKVEAMEVSQDIGIALKVIRNQRLGFAFTTIHDEVGKTINAAIDSAKWTAMDEYIDIPGQMPAGEVLIFDEQIKNLDEATVIKNALMLEESALAFDKRVKKVRKAEVGAAVTSTTIANSKGVNAGYESTNYSVHVTTLASDENGDNQMGWDFAGSRRMIDVDIKFVGKTASKRAVEVLGARKISAVKAPVILCPSVAVGFLDILSSSLSAEAVQKQRSFLAGKAGQTIISTLVDIIDDGTMKWGLGTKPVDDEGVPVTNKTVISKGVLNSYFYNTYTAKKAGVKSTGNAVRGGHKSLPGIGVTNFYIRPDESQKSEVRSQKSEVKRTKNNQLIKSLPKGILILNTMGLHTANPISGDFSVGISGLWIENGETVYPIKEAVISGNILELFKKVEGIGCDLEFYGNVGSPSLLIGDMDISA
ncbi:MAG: TldD/PmbA family protein [Nitrospirae bacterium]|nr:TldD/PmbA family protein [Nitrospirota bacterium]